MIGILIPLAMLVMAYATLFTILDGLVCQSGACGDCWQCEERHELV